MNTSKTRVLFVDDEPQILKLLELMLRPLQEGWEVVFAGSGQEALALLSKQPCDIVVSDMRMPAMTGVELLNLVMKRHPHTVRIILSAYADQEMVLRSIGSTHMYLSKPVEAEGLRATLQRIRNLSARLRSGSIRAVVSEMSLLPSIPSVYLHISNALQSTSVSSLEIGEIVATDPGLCAKILQLANSAFFGSASSVSNAEEAVQFLGVGIIAALALTHQLFSSLDPRKYREFQVEKIWNHSVQTGVMARKLARCQTRDANLAEVAFTSGLLHDVGKLILLDQATDSYRTVCAKSRQPKVRLEQAERAAFNVDHADVGAYLLGIWGLPSPLVESVYYHHCPLQSIDQEFSVLTAVHVANVLAQDKPAGQRLPSLGALDSAYLARLGLEARVHDWVAEIFA